MEERKKVLYPELAAEMARHGHTYATLGKVLNRSEASISRKFSGVTAWTLNDVRLICEFYKKDYYSLFGNRG